MRRRLLPLFIALAVLVSGCGIVTPGGGGGEGSLVVRLESVPEGVADVTIFLEFGGTAVRTETVKAENGSASFTFGGLKVGAWFVRAEARRGADAVYHAYDWVSILAGKTEVLVLDLSGDVRSKIAFVSDSGGTSDIWVMGAAGDNPVNVTKSTSRDDQPSLSPDGKMIAFRSNRGGATDIWVMAADGSNPTRLTSGSSTDQQPEWSPSGDKLAFVSNRDGQPDIWIMNADGSEPFNLTFGSGAQHYTPKWSSDGEKIAFQSNRSGTWDIYVINVDGTGLMRLTNDTARNQDPAWSPDGQRIAFKSRANGGTFDIVVMNSDGSNPVFLTQDEWTNQNPVWSPDGTKIAYASTRDGKTDIYVIDVDGNGEAIKLTGHLGGNNSYPSWR